MQDFYTFHYLTWENPMTNFLRRTQPERYTRTKNGHGRSYGNRNMEISENFLKSNKQCYIYILENVSEYQKKKDLKREYCWTLRKGMKGRSNHAFMISPSTTLDLH